MNAESPDTADTENGAARVNSACPVSAVNHMFQRVINILRFPGLPVNGDSPVLGPGVEPGRSLEHAIHSRARLPFPPSEPGSHRRADENDAYAVTYALRVRRKDG